jgi:hypothetical protein
VACSGSAMTSTTAFWRCSEVSWAEGEEERVMATHRGGEK